METFVESIKAGALVAASENDKPVGVVGVAELAYAGGDTSQPSLPLDVVAEVAKADVARYFGDGTDATAIVSETPGDPKSKVLFPNPWIKMFFERFTYPLRDPKLKRFISHRIHGFLVYLPTNLPLNSTIGVGKYTLHGCFQK